MNTAIDFHSNVSHRLEYAYRLIRKACAARCRVVVWHQDKDQLMQFDELLWQFSATDFLPHVVLDQGHHPLAQRTPILLTLDTDATLPHHEILLNLSDQTPAGFAQFKRLIEIVAQELPAVQAGRKRYRFYQQQGYLPNHLHAQ